jgi:hypothetical protein
MFGFMLIDCRSLGNVRGVMQVDRFKFFVWSPDLLPGTSVGNGSVIQLMIICYYKFCILYLSKKKKKKVLYILVDRKCDIRKGMW